MVLSKIYQLDDEVTREDIDRVFDAHWHNGFMIRHLIYKLSRGETADKPVQSSPIKKRPAPRGNLDVYERKRDSPSKVLHSGGSQRSSLV